MTHPLVTAPPAAREAWPGFDALLQSAARRAGGGTLREVVHPGGHSNLVAEVRFATGRTLVLKRARHYPETAARRLETARAAARHLRERAGVVAPEHLDLPLRQGGFPVEAYWRIPLPVLREVWRGLSTRGRAAALRSWGRLLGRMRAAPAAGSGVAPVAGGDLRGDLEHRLLPALRGVWPAAVETAERLARAAPAVEARAARRPPVLVHGDMHMGNVLCEGEGDEVRCVGVLDLEEAFVGPPEAEWATLELMHGPLFGMPLPGGWLGRVEEGYGRGADPALLAFFRAYRLLNLGCHAAATGLDAHAAQVADAAAAEAERLETVSRRPAVRRRRGGVQSSQGKTSASNNMDWHAS